MVHTYDSPKGRGTYTAAASSQAEYPGQGRDHYGPGYGVNPNVQSKSFKALQNLVDSGQGTRARQKRSHWLFDGLDSMSLYSGITQTFREIIALG